MNTAYDNLRKFGNHKDGCQWIGMGCSCGFTKALIDAKMRFVEGKRFTHCVDSYGTYIYEGDEILDEVAGTTDFVVEYKGTWYVGDKNGYVLDGQLLAHLQRKCKVVE